MLRGLPRSPLPDTLFPYAAPFRPQPAQSGRDAREHGVEVRPICINRSRWDCTLEEGEGLLPLRLGLRMVRGLSNDHTAQILAVRGDMPFSSIENVWRR